MSTLCPLCKGSKPGKRPAGLGKSKVVETRRKPCHVTLRGKTTRNTTLVRIRQCLKCRYRWRTMEVILYEKRKYSSAWGGRRGPARAEYKVK